MTRLPLEWSCHWQAAVAYRRYLSQKNLRYGVLSAE